MDVAKKPHPFTLGAAGRTPGLVGRHRHGGHSSAPGVRGRVGIESGDADFRFRACRHLASDHDGSYAFLGHMDRAVPGTPMGPQRRRHLGENSVGMGDLTRPYWTVSSNRKKRGRDPVIAGKAALFGRHRLLNSRDRSAHTRNDIELHRLLKYWSGDLPARREDIGCNFTRWCSNPKAAKAVPCAGTSRPNRSVIWKVSGRHGWMLCSRTWTFFW